MDARTPLLPWLAVTVLATTAVFLVAVEVGDRWASDVATTSIGLAAVPFYLGFVGLAAALPVAAARGVTTRACCLTVMLFASGWAGWEVSTTDDAQAGLAVFIVPFVAVPLAGAVLIGESMAARRFTTDTPHAKVGAASDAAKVADRAAALLLDILIVGAVLAVPLSRLSDSGLELLALAIGIAAATAYFTVGVSWRGGSPGQRLLGLAVVDATSGEPLGLARAAGRGFLIVIEVLGAGARVLLPLAVLDLALAGTRHRSIIDHLTRTRIITTRQ